MRLATLPHVRFTSLFVLLFALIATVIAQEAPELVTVATISDDEWTLSISHPEDWVLGASNPDVSDVLHSLLYDLPE